MDRSSKGGESRGRKIPLGIPDLDTDLGGGVRPGTTILPIGPVGSGPSEFAHSCAIMHGNWQADSELFDLEYRNFDRPLSRPDEVHYFSVVDRTDRFRGQLEAIADPRWVDVAFENITVHSLADELADLGIVRPTPEGRFEYEAYDGNVVPYKEFLYAFGDKFSESLSDGLVIVDSLSDFLPLMYRYLEPSDIFFAVQTITHSVESSNSILIAPADSSFYNRREQAFVERPFDVVLRSDWFGEGGNRRRMLELSKFPEFWVENPGTERVVYDVSLDRNQFGISDVQKIPPSKW
ncbi:MAG: RAD55 family ATPase [Halanaeroarchaeum sp.]